MALWPTAGLAISFGDNVNVRALNEILYWLTICCKKLSLNFNSKTFCFNMSVQCIQHFMVSFFRFDLVQLSVKLLAVITRYSRL